MEGSADGEGKTVAMMKVKAVEATPDSFKEFGQVIESSPDGEDFGPRDAQLDLSRGTPRQKSIHFCCYLT